ncbi:MAG: hypothetical protein D8M58_03270 [Calditrichaeota bacterium]|nr:MAG: hypothetical protein DWQ03_03810 [Calditrichota bacterium]MBL1204387.1 hypothetical protein [Calditrichota bacterium]NOG44216.1 SpoIIE family protein phosphatase [Calditrichota bacterium]
MLNIDLYQQVFFTTFAVAFTMLHFVLYMHNRHIKSNLYFALFTLLFAANIFFDFQATIENEFFYLQLHRVVMPYNPIFMLLFIYSIFELVIPKQFWIITIGLIVTGVLAVFEPVANLKFVIIFQIGLAIEVFRLMVFGITKQKDGAKVLSFGFFLLFVFSTYDVFMDMGLINAYYGIYNGYPFGFIGLIFSTSAYLAADFSRKNKQIILKEQQAKQHELELRILELEDTRKSKELQDARDLQLSMLPNCMTELGGYETCFEMKPAAEVGGDYYDYHISEDGTLTLAIGDATGHGMKAGIMVSIMKSMFIAHEKQKDITTFFEESTHTIKKMGLGNLYMALMIFKIKDGRLYGSSAGMPPFFIYRADTKSVEEVTVKGMPLGAFESFPYKTFETNLNPGDTLLFLSDGLIELFNEQNETLDIPRIKDAFAGIADASPNEIAQNLLRIGDEWRKDRKQDDDITLVILKVMKI